MSAQRIAFDFVKKLKDEIERIKYETDKDEWDNQELVGKSTLNLIYETYGEVEDM